MPSLLLDLGAMALAVTGKVSVSCTLNIKQVKNPYGMTDNDK